MVVLPAQGPPVRTTRVISAEEDMAHIETILWLWPPCTQLPEKIGEQLLFPRNPTASFFSPGWILHLQKVSRSPGIGVGDEETTVATEDVGDHEDEKGCARVAAGTVAGLLQFLATTIGEEVEVDGFDLRGAKAAVALGKFLAVLHHEFVGIAIDQFIVLSEDLASPVRQADLGPPLEP